MTAPSAMEDLEVRAGSAGSLVRTFIGVHLREIGGWIGSAALTSLLVDAGATTAGVRSALTRVRASGLLTGERHPVTADRGDRSGAAGLRLVPAAVPMLERGDRRVFGHRRMADGDPWTLVVFAVPEAMRPLRHRLRTRLTWLGFAPLAPGTWIGPGHLAGETEDVLTEQGLRDYVTLVAAGDPHPPVPLRTAVATWWDLAALRERHETFLDRHRDDDAPATAREAFAAHLRLVDDWRAIPSLDPGLPPALCPDGWPGHDAVALFTRLHTTLSGPARDHVSAVTG